LITLLALPHSQIDWEEGIITAYSQIADATR